MKRMIKYSVVILLLVSSFLSPAVVAQTKEKTIVDTKELTKLRTAVESAPNDINAHIAYITAMGLANPDLKEQYERWLIKFPTSVVLPFAIGEKYYQREMPQATPFLLKVVARDPSNAKVWNMLSIDAQRWGDRPKAIEFIGKAVAAAPKNVDYACSQVSLYSLVDAEAYKKMTWELVKKFPDSPMVAAAISMMGYEEVNIDEKIRIYESLKNLFPNTELYKAVAMSRLNEAYIVKDQPEKAMELASTMAVNSKWDWLRFSEMKNFASKLVDLKKAMGAGKLNEALEMMPAVNAANGKSDKSFNIGNYLILLNAKIFDTTGATQAAYDTLLIYQSKTPDDKVGIALDKYGAKLGKNSLQVLNDIRANLKKRAMACPEFSLELYTSNSKLSLADLKGKVTLLTFWFPGCGPCRGEMPYFEKVVDKYKSDNFAYLGINVMPAQNDYVLPFMKGTGYTFTPLKGEWKWAKEKFGVRGAPSNFIIDREGNIIYSDFMIDGENTRMLELMLESLI